MKAGEHGFAVLCWVWVALALAGYLYQFKDLANSILDLFGLS